MDSHRYPTVIKEQEPALDLSRTRRRHSLESRFTVSSNSSVSSISSEDKNTPPVPQMFVEQYTAYNDSSQSNTRTPSPHMNSDTTIPMPVSQNLEELYKYVMHPPFLNLYDTYYINENNQAMLVASELMSAQRNTEIIPYNKSETKSVPENDVLQFLRLIRHNCDGEAVGPFKSYPKDPQQLMAKFAAVQVAPELQYVDKYKKFRQIMLEQNHASNGVQSTVSNHRMRRSISSSSQVDSDSNNSADTTMKDNAYYERRKD